MHRRNLKNDKGGFGGLLGGGAGLLANPVVLLVLVIIVIIGLAIIMITGTLFMAFIGAFLPVIFIGLGIVTLLQWIPVLRGRMALIVGFVLIIIGAGMGIGVLPHFM